MNKDKLKKKIKNTAANAKNEINYGSKKGKTIKAREGGKLLSAGGKALRAAGKLGKGIGAAGLVLGGAATATSLYKSLKRGEGYARLFKRKKKK